MQINKHIHEATEATLSEKRKLEHVIILHRNDYTDTETAKHSRFKKPRTTRLHHQNNAHTGNLIVA